MDYEDDREFDEDIENIMSDYDVVEYEEGLDSESESERLGLSDKDFFF